MMYDYAVLGSITSEGALGVARGDAGGWTPYGGTIVDTVAKSASLLDLTAFGNFALTQLATCPVVNAKVFLQGPFASDSMRTTLGTNGLVPLLQPYNGPPWNYSGLEAVQRTPAGVVDWVLVEVRTGDPQSPPMTTLARRAAFVRFNGALVDTDGISPVSFFSIAPASYYLVVRHRNHIPLMSAMPVAISNASGQYDFASRQGMAYSADTLLYPAMKDLGGGTFGMYAGDANGDGQVTQLDSDAWLANSGTAATGYLQTDFNCDGQNTTRDFDPWLMNSKRGMRSRVP